MPSQTKNVTIDGLAFRCAVQEPSARPGAPWLVFSNSLMTDLSLWDDQIAAFGDRYRIMVYDQRGHGGTSVPETDCTFDRLVEDLRALLDAFAIERAVVVGVSMGGITALRFGSRHPDRVTGLVISDAGAATAPGGRQAWDERIALGKAGGMNALVEPTIGRWFAPETLEAGRPVLDRVRAMVAATPFEGFVRATRALQDYDFKADLGRLSAPTLMVAGAHDGATPEAMRTMTAAVRGARFEEIAGAGHLPNIEQPEAFNRVLADFLGALPQDDGERPAPSRA